MTDSRDPKTGLLIRNPEGLHDPEPLGYSHLAIFPTQGRLVSVAGQGGGPNKGDFADQTQIAFENIDKAMKAAGGDIGGVGKITAYIVDHSEEKHAVLIDAVKSAFGDRLTPTCTIVPLTRLGTDRNMLVEIEAWGVVPDNADLDSSNG